MSTVSYSVTPGDGWDVGVYAPLVIRFASKITDRAAVEHALTVESSKPVVGAWSWINSSEVHFRPQTPWPTHTTIRLVAALKNVKVAANMLGLPQHHGHRRTPATRVLAKVDGSKHTFTVFVNGKVWAKWPTSLGRPEFVTRTGSYIVLEKKPMVEMTSCSVHIACDPKDPNFYDLKVMQDVRLTWSGTFVHAAPWSVSHQGFANVSHGCINLSTSRATVVLRPRDVRRHGDGRAHQPRPRRPDGQGRPRHDGLERLLHHLGAGLGPQGADHHVLDPRLTPAPDPTPTPRVDLERMQADTACRACIRSRSTQTGDGQGARRVALSVRPPTVPCTVATAPAAR